MDNSFSETYRQLFRLFQTLENASFAPGVDFGENLTGCFQWFVAPPAVDYLEKQSYNFWDSLKKNKKIIYRLEPWQGFKDQAASISVR